MKDERKFNSLRKQMAKLMIRSHLFDETSLIIRCIATDNNTLESQKFSCCLIQAHERRSLVMRLANRDVRKEL
ncbi:CLUMA_CG008030, isoform A [Clunio marinus]|uniref:CLUMA_CG008030, isoform A n=1 Tax=Clunio marinus TaxID=568069 RepID=A0A1J1I2F8_9DIPT|nr:CLUMA_CG008030, isoform A [Clunio marinus]